MADISNIPRLGLVLDRERRQQLNRFRQEQDPLPEPEFDIWDYAGDLLAAPFRGAEGLVHGVYGLADTLLLDSLPDYDSRVLGRSKTMVGGIAEGIANFALGFVPVAGWIGRGAQLGRAGRFVPGLAKLSKGSQLAAKAAGKVKTAGAIELGRFAAAGAITDLAVFDGHEQRLSNLIESFPALQNPVTEFLAANDDDPELIGRLKTSIEGLGVGSLVDALIVGLRGVKAARKARSEGVKSPEALGKIVDDATVGRQEEVFGGIENQKAAEIKRGEVERPMVSPFRTTGDRFGKFPIYSGEIGGTTFRIHRDGKNKWVVEGETQSLGPTKAKAIEALRNRMELSASSDRIATSGPRFIGDPKMAEEIIDTVRAKMADPDQSASNPRNLDAQELAAEEMTEKDLNLLRMESEPAVVVRSIEKTFPEQFADLKTEVPNPKSLERSQQDLADMSNMNNQGLGIRADRDIKTAEQLMHRTLAWKVYLTRSAKELVGIIDRILGSEAVDSKVMGEFLQGVDRVGLSVRAYKGLTAIQGRGLQHGNIRFLDIEALEAVIIDAGGTANVKKMAQQMREAFGEGGIDGIRGLNAQIEASYGSNTLKVLTEYWMNSILSGGKTLAVNFASGALLTIYRPFEQMMGGLLTGNSKAIRDAANEFHGFIDTFKESAKAAVTSGVRNEAQLAPGKRIHETAGAGARTPAIHVDNPQSLAGHMINYLGSVIRTPSAILTGTDEFFKQMNYRMVAKSQFLREALDQGMTPQAAAQFTRDKMDKLITNFQAFNDNTLFKEAMEEAKARKVDDDGTPFRSLADMEEWSRTKARERFDESESVLRRTISEEGVRAGEDVTFTGALRKDRGPLESLSATLQDVVIKHPWMRFMAPFIRTPVNILKYTSDRTLDPALGIANLLTVPFRKKGLKALEGSKNRLLSDLLATGDTPLAKRMAQARKTQAIGRVATGVGILSTFSALAHQGVITGKGPTDPEQRRILEAAGWLPYSFKVGDSYIQYLRLDPWATMIGTVADMVTVGKYAPSDDQGEVEEMATTLMIALANNVTNKTYLTGIRNVLGSLTDPERSMARTMQRYAASFVPSGPAQVGAQLAGDDPVFRDVRSIGDAMLNKLPYYGEGIAPIRNFLGEPVSKIRALGSDISAVADLFVPVAYREVSDDFIMQEIAQLNHAFSPPRAKLGGLDLREFQSQGGQTAYDRMLELRQEVRVGGVPLRTALRKLMRSRAYQRITPESTFELQSPRIGEINKVVGRYHRLAVRQVRREFPDLAAAVQLQRQNKRLARQGGSIIPR